MGVTEKTAILVISFGTSYEETRKKTIEQIESDLHHAFPEYPLYRAWTSPRIRAKLRKRDGIHIMDIDEAMTQLKADGIRNVIVQPTYVITAQLHRISGRLWSIRCITNLRETDLTISQKN